MGKETTIKISREFKERLRGEKKDGEDFEATLKRLIGDRKSEGIPEESQYTSEEKGQYTDSKEKTFTNLSDFNLEVHKRNLERKSMEISN